MENCLVHGWFECAVQEAPNSVTAFFVRLKEKDECIVCCSITDCKASTAGDYCYYYWCVIKSTMTSSPLYGVCGENYWSRLIILCIYLFFFWCICEHLSPDYVDIHFHQEPALWRNCFFLSCWGFSIQVFESLHRHITVLSVSSSLFMTPLKRQSAWVLRSWAS